ncbi:hypothetical protein F2Q68_00013104 [Brassica cretica]|uniref:DYW domain-containing protein n=1 Tax=Brassica cretica TaxID=69181 RepID=A0A8S9HDF6_BRACR|nr:hypothetical protein F2Q68_00013104 [Brassica cretica]
MKAQLLLRRAFCSSVTPSAKAKITHLSRTSQIHEARKLFDSCDSNSVSSWNSMVSEHFTNRMPREAQLLFDQMAARNITSWNGLVSGYMNNGEMEEARKVFDDDASHEAGYNPDCYVEEEEKVDRLSERYHSQRLAVAYGLLKLPEGVPLRVLKNLRVCRDCHAAIKLISKEIILRDAKRSHHFKNGECSCKVIAEVQ